MIQTTIIWLEILSILWYRYTIQNNGINCPLESTTKIPRQPSNGHLLMQYPLLHDQSGVLCCQHVLWWLSWFMDLLFHTSMTVPYSLSHCILLSLEIGSLSPSSVAICISYVWVYLIHGNYSSLASLNCPLSPTLGAKIVSCFFLDVIWFDSWFLPLTLL